MWLTVYKCFFVRPWSRQCLELNLHDETNQNKRLKVCCFPNSFDDFKNKHKSVWRNLFWYVKVCISWKSIQVYYFFFCELQLIPVLLLICDSFMSWSTRFVSLKLCVGFSVFDSVSFLLKFIFLFNKMHGLFDCKIPFKMKIIEKSHTDLIFKLQQEILKWMISAWVGAPQKLTW